jgi:hypothetical protein
MTIKGHQNERHSSKDISQTKEHSQRKTFQTKEHSSKDISKTKTKGINTIIRNTLRKDHLDEKWHEKTKHTAPRTHPHNNPQSTFPSSEEETKTQPCYIKNRSFLKPFVRSFAKTSINLTDKTSGTLVGGGVYNTSLELRRHTSLNLKTAQRGLDCVTHLSEWDRCRDFKKFALKFAVNS